ncbi:MAG: KpsF/GutQ family sugar-phosphate isomerase [Endomicrobium sp.]|jgi:arabinose-5-phosphate isomerase|nr:KpsF/GutQ family sugar-phosphate isomerase [Endomicrobium sp.]
MSIDLGLKMKKFKTAIETLKIEARSIEYQLGHLDSNFGSAVSLIKNCKGHVVIVGLGKSGLIGRKISSTMSSLGIPSTFLHLTDGLHGDVGMLIKDDLVIMLSYSGETEGIKEILSVLKKIEIEVIVMTGKVLANVWQDSKHIIDCSVEKEACPYNLAPTSSTTAMLAMGDALSITVSKLKGFKKKNLAVLHPFGSIGKRLTTQACDVMRKGNRNPVVKQTAIVEEALFVMTSTGVGATSVVDNDDKIVGFFTDGDLLRHLQTDKNVLWKNITSVMTKNPKIVYCEKMAVEAAVILKKYNIDNIPVVDKDKKLLGILDQGDLLTEGFLN